MPWHESMVRIKSRVVSEAHPLAGMAMVEVVAYSLDPLHPNRF